MKSCKILRISNVTYQAAIEEMYQTFPEANQYPYEKQLELFFQQGIVYSDSFSRAMRTLGYEAIEILCDIEKIQKTWAKENKVRFGKEWKIKILLAQIAKIKPDVLFFQDIHSLPYAIRKNLKQDFPFIKKVIVHKGFPGAFNELDDVDVLFAGTPTLVRQFEEGGVKAKLLYHAFDDSVLEKVKTVESNNEMYNFSFLGSSGYGWGEGHKSRYWALVQLMLRAPLEVWSFEKENEASFLSPTYIRNALKQYLLKKTPAQSEKILAKVEKIPANQIRRQLSNLVKEAIKEQTSPASDIPPVPLRELFPQLCHKEKFGLKMYKILQLSKITFNRHTDAALDSVGNIRLFQATGMGACLLSDTAANMTDLYEPDQEIVTYQSTDECVEKVNYLLNHDQERQEIALAGQKRTLRDHTMKNRCEQIHEVIQTIL